MRRLRFAAASALATLAAISASPQESVGARIAASERAAEALQGPLDGAWVLRDASGRPLVMLQIVDPPAPRSHLELVWRRPGPEATLAFGALWRRRRTIVIELGREKARFRLTSGGWRGEITAGGRARPVSLTRG